MDKFLARLREDWASASQHFVTALRYAAADGWAWGVQAALCNLGLASMERGDWLRGRRQEMAYRDAQQLGRAMHPVR